MCFGEKDIPIWWSFIFAEGPFLAKSDLASTIPSNTMLQPYVNTEHGKNRYISIYKSYAVESSHLTRFPKPLRSSLSKSKKKNGFKN